MNQSKQDSAQRSVLIHEQLRGKIAIHNKMPLDTRDDLSLAYTPGVARPCEEIAQNPERVWDLTIKNNSVAVVSDGSAVLGLGNIGAHAAIPVMEGKAMLFKEFADIDAWPICLDTQDTDTIVQTVKHLAPVFGGINLEDIAAPRCFEIEERLQDIEIPVFHDDQHGTAIVLLAALINAARITGKTLDEMTVVVCGGGAAGTAIAKLLRCVGHDPDVCVPVKDIVVCDSRGAIHRNRTDLSPEKEAILGFTNRSGQEGSLQEVLRGKDVFIGVSRGNLLNQDDIRSMADDPIVLAMANPIPEIMPDDARAAGAAIIGTGRSDFPNQVNNVLAFPGIFRGALNARASSITDTMKIAAAHALADAVEDRCPERILPDPLDRSIAPRVAQAVQTAAEK